MLEVIGVKLHLVDVDVDKKVDLTSNVDVDLDVDVDVELDVELNADVIPISLVPQITSIVHWQLHWHKWTRKMKLKLNPS